MPVFQKHFSFCATLRSSVNRIAVTVFNTTSFAHQCCFYFLQRSPFTLLTTAMMKIMSMTAGDFSFDIVFRRCPSGESEDAQDILFPPISYILRIIFVILMPILFTNMLVNISAICMLYFCESILHLACKVYVIFLFRNQRLCIAAFKLVYC